MAKEEEKSTETPAPLIPGGASAEESLRNLHSDHDEELLAKLREYARPLILGVTLALTIFIGIQALRWKSHQAERNAAALYAQAQTPETQEKVAREYPKTAIAPMALLRAASGRYQDGRYEQAEALFREFGSLYSEHLMAPSAEAGAAFCMEAANRWSDAEAAYARFLQAHPGHFQAPLVQFGRARVLAQLGRFAEARAVYEDFIAGHAESDWRGEAETGLRLLTLQEKAPLSLAAPAAGMPSLLTRLPEMEPVTPSEAPAAPETQEPAEASPEAGAAPSAEADPSPDSP